MSDEAIQYINMKSDAQLSLGIELLKTRPENWREKARAEFQSIPHWKNLKPAICGVAQTYDKDKRNYAIGIHLYKEAINSGLMILG